MEDKTNKLISFICGAEPTDTCVLTITQLVRTMERACRECMADRKYVLLDPQCKDRFYLSLLVEAGVSLDDLPRDCYKIRLEEIKKVVAGKPVPISVEDGVVMLRDYLKMLVEGRNIKISKKKISAIKSAEKLKDLIESIASQDEGIKVYHFDKKSYLAIMDVGSVPQINLLDYERALAFVNLKRRPIKYENVMDFVKFMADIFGLSVEPYLSPSGIIYMKVHIKGKLDLGKLGDKAIDVRVSPLEDGHLVLVRLGQKGRMVRYGDLIDIMASLRG